FAIKRRAPPNSDPTSSLTALRSLLRRRRPFRDLVVRAHTNATAQRCAHRFIFYLLCNLPHHLRIFSRTGCAARRRLQPWTIFFLFLDCDRDRVCRSRKIAPHISKKRSIAVIPSRADGEGPHERRVRPSSNERSFAVFAAQDNTHNACAWLRCENFRLTFVGPSGDARDDLSLFSKHVIN